MTERSHRRRLLTGQRLPLNHKQQQQVRADSPVSYCLVEYVQEDLSEALRDSGPRALEGGRF